jgi:hypothetical protein
VPKHFADDDHALQTGYLAGTLAKAGITCSIERDEIGNYKPFLHPMLVEPGELEPIRVAVAVLPGETEGASDEHPVHQQPLERP